MDSGRLEELLLTVQKPGRYVGGEWNSVKKEWAGDKIKVLLAFPDVYEVGMSYLGMKILYGILNGRDDCLCERVFSPWTDFEQILRTNRVDLFSLESRKPAKEFDIIGISVAYELSYSNVLNLLNLGGIPLRSSGRTDEDPLIIAGGPSVYNPEPIAEFIDAFVIGDGEDVINEIVDLYKELRTEGTLKRPNLLRKLSRIKGIYVPSLYEINYKDDATIGNIKPAEENIPPKVSKRTVRDFDKAYYPVDQIVPNIGIVHDRIAIEIMRGCKHACKFCQATVAYRPARERSAKTVIEIARKAYAATGYDEISLLSLSSIDHSELHKIAEGLNREFLPRAVSISVPSLRIEDALKDLPTLISEVKKSGLTFAPEAGSDPMRKFLGKNVKIERLFEAVSESFRRGWRRIKLYFMIGLPGETDEDIAGIAELIRKISNLKRDIDGRPAQVTASINAFVPKPHTQFQREGMDAIQSLERKRSMLRDMVRSKMIDLDFNPLDRSYLEAVLARGDRKLGAVIYDAWKSGAKFDSWQEHFKFEIWRSSFERMKIDASFYAFRPRQRDEMLPWDIIDMS
ncbi:MAG: TIGR03960 family B12-binding radical SAM protein [Candidatus Omnitrophica bacterium]|nr:TIGR03960 family B12-binding radical SAM protein [Candidatus Omnitrophota bacterium]